VQVYKAALSSVQQFSTIDEHIKTYTPQILVMTGLPNMRPSLVDFAYLFCKNNSLMICGDILKVSTVIFKNLNLPQLKWLPCLVGATESQTTH
jgi:solute carrier family 12 sodium/potassium/chloride transporter 2